MGQLLTSVSEEVEEFSDRLKSLRDEATSGLDIMTSSYESQKTLDQGLTHVEQSLADLSDSIDGLSEEKAERGDLAKSLQVCDTTSHLIGCTAADADVDSAWVIRFRPCQHRDLSCTLLWRRYGMTLRIKCRRTLVNLAERSCRRD